VPVLSGKFKDTHLELISIETCLYGGGVTLVRNRERDEGRLEDFLSEKGSIFAEPSNNLCAVRIPSPERIESLMCLVLDPGNAVKGKASDKYSKGNVMQMINTYLVLRLLISLSYLP
jgi:hypothetical protein